jgi:hypothetical protein
MSIWKTLFGKTGAAAKQGGPSVQIAEGRREAPRSFVLLLGETRERIHAELGVPDATGDDFDSYFSHGVGFDYAAGTAAAVFATKFKDCEPFRGEILGVRLGDSMSTCLSLWGIARNERDSGFLNYSVFSWDFNGYCIDLEIWKSDGTDTAFGARKKGTVKRMRVSRQAR